MVTFDSWMGWGLSLHKLTRLLACAAPLLVAASTASAQEPVTQVFGGTTITLGGGVQLLSLPDIDFTFKVNDSGAAVRK